MADEIVKVENGGALIALDRFGLSLRQRTSLLKEIAAGMLVSVRRTFREQGSPDNSWAPLAASTLRKKPNGPGRKILIVSGRLLNSIQATSDDTSVTLGTNLIYARVQQEGSADRAGSIGPQARIPGRSVSVPAHRRVRAAVKNLGYGRHEVLDEAGPMLVRARIQGPVPGKVSDVAAHERFQNIPARPYLVFRPEDQPRIQGQVIAFAVRAALQAGLQASGGTA